MLDPANGKSGVRSAPNRSLFSGPVGTGWARTYGGFFRNSAPRFPPCVANRIRPLVARWPLSVVPFAGSEDTRSPLLSDPNRHFCPADSPRSAARSAIGGLLSQCVRNLRFWAVPASRGRVDVAAPERAIGAGNVQVILTTFTLGTQGPHRNGGYLRHIAAGAPS
jgi:hypothetical protein